MIKKTQGGGRKRTRSGRLPRKSERLRKGDPLEVELTVSFKFGEEPGDTLTPIKGRKVPMVNSVFASRDVIVRSFVNLMIKTGLSSPKVAGQLAPVARLLRKRSQ
ncbi:MAG: hypothetical protein PHP86_05155 [Nevskiales bacterium]|nr:hypothetical protein [Nevskiales bacterium]